MPDGLTFTFHGVRGSVAIDRPDSARYGGATISISARLADDHYLVLDAGTGLRDLQHHLPEEGSLRFSFLVTHFHWDHLLGLPFFRPLYQPSASFDFYATAAEGGTVESGIAGVMEPPLFPLPLRSVLSALSFVDVPADPWEIGPVTVRAAHLHHPQGVNAYRIDFGESSLVLATDVEAGEPESDRALIALARGADVLIHDAQYLPTEIETYKGWGHSTWEEAVEIAEAAGVERLVIISHDPERTDDGVDELEAAARKRFPNTDAAFAGMQLTLPGR
ncbi:MAG: MBL fold metallo-hydrolase [Acidimicrobiia bacterium]|nr:MBL fold metallo-hydrolase [Acidimicrobiia bacterium]NNF86978.1 MBL fold metallo-hydrolase [Acidimicrobiia bacterium]NNL12546.1 MBL fold metallo-hydrolase [Acidimicrobiia bacterium]NNL69615.1 MBL fold metallo-hydrolase [Acidimicrobiia bacterium]RZV41570.1 MAG: MBL fold metallo-hydrolase [Acidimicrobiia bacterium]